MSRKLISLKSLSKICGKKRQTIFEIIEFLKNQDNGCTVKEIQSGISYKESSRHIYILINRLIEIGFIEKIDDNTKPPFKYRIAGHEFLILLEG